MKKLLILALGVVAASATAQNFRSTSFLNVRAIQVEDTISITNLSSVTYTRGTNIASTVFTNLAGVQVTSSAANGADRLNLLGTVPLWASRNADPVSPNITNSVAMGPADGPYFANINIRLNGGADANSAVQFVFAGVPSDNDRDSQDSDLVKIINVTANGATMVESVVSIGVLEFPFCKGVMLRSITNPDTGAAGEVKVLECTLNGYSP